MPYVRRAADGSIASLHRRAADEAVEFLDDHHPEVLGFVGLGAVDAAGDGGFAELDADFIRVLEDLIELLIRKHVITVTDLPVEARRKLYQRKGRREPTALAELNLLGDAGPAGNPFDSIAAGFPRGD